MSIKLLFPSLALLLLTSAPAQGEQKTFTETVRVVMGSRETQDEAREYALLEAKRRVLERVGVYFTGQTDFVRRVSETAASFKDVTDLKRQIQTVAAGVTQTEVSGEEWKMEGGVFVLYLTCCVTVETGDVEKLLSETLKDRDKTEVYINLLEEFEQLRANMDTLRGQIEKAPTEQTQKLREERKNISNELTASNWLEKGYNATSLEKMVECFSKAIELNPHSDDAFTARGTTFIEIKDSKQAINDFEQAIQINPQNARAFNNRGVIYFDKYKFKLAISDFSRAIEINPDFTSAWYNLGLAYEFSYKDANARHAYKRAMELGHPNAKQRLDELR